MPTRTPHFLGLLFAVAAVAAIGQAFAAVAAGLLAVLALVVFVGFDAPDRLTGVRRSCLIAGVWFAVGLTFGPQFAASALLPMLGLLAGPFVVATVIQLALARGPLGWAPLAPLIPWVAGEVLIMGTALSGTPAGIVVAGTLMFGASAWAAAEFRAARRIHPTYVTA